MPSHLELFALPWGPFPRRVLIYLAEKRIINSPHLNIVDAHVTPQGTVEAPGKAPGSLPQLVLPDGTRISQSLSVIDYFEDIIDQPQEAWQHELAEMAGPNSSMRGITVAEKARNRDMLSLTTELTAYLMLMVRRGNAISALMVKESSAETAKHALDTAQRLLDQLEEYYEGFEQRLETNQHGRLAVVDCVLFSHMQYLCEFHGRDVTQMPVLRRNLNSFYNLVKERESAKINADQLYPSEFRDMAKVWL